MRFIGANKGIVLALAAACVGTVGCSTSDEPTEVGSTEEAVLSTCTISLASPQQATGAIWGDTVHVDATASCPSGTPEIQYYERVGNVQWTIVKPYSTAIALDYDTHNATTVGTLQFYAAVRRQGVMESPALSSTISINLADNVPSCTAIKLTSPANGATFQAGSNVTLTAVATCPGTPEYEYWVKPSTSSTWTVLPSSTTYAPGSITWVPPNTPGTWNITAVARVIGAHVTYQVRASGIGVTITAAPQNQPPTVSDVPMTVAENSVANVGTGSATDPDNDTLTVTAVGTPSHGSASIAGGMSFTYSPNGGYAGPDAFSYTVDDGHGHAVNGTVNVTVTTQNPVPGTHNLTTTRSKPVNADLAAGDSDPDGDPVHVASVGAPTHGTTTLEANGTVTYAPTTGYVGGDDFTYGLADNHGGTATGSVHVDVTDGAPVANDDGPFTTRGNTALTGIAVLGNDTDPDGDPLAVQSVASPSANGGTVTTNGATVDYTPPTNFLGTDTFTYVVTDGVLTASATVTVNVSEGTISCTGGSVNTTSNATVNFDAIATAGCVDVDGDPLTITGVTSPAAHGVLTVGAGGASSYTPTTNYTGADGFSFVVDDGHGASVTASIAIFVNDQPPTANPDTVSTNVNTPASFNVLTNDTDPDGGTLSVTGNTAPAHGTVTVGSDGAASYTPAASYVGSDSFDYTLSDGQGGTATGTVSITVNAVAPGCTVSVTSQETSVVYGQDIHLTATASCTTGAAQILWWVAKPGSAYMVSGTWGSSTTLTVTSSVVGTYKFYAQARTVGTTTPVATSSVVSVNVADTVAPCTSVKMTQPLSGQTFTGGTPVTLAAQAVCPAGVTPEYQFWVKKATDTTFTILPGYTTTTTTWTTPVGQPGSWAITAVVRGVGSHVTYTARANSIGITLN